MQMDEMCMVMCGAWLCGSDGKWEFVVDKTKMARMIPVHEALTIKEIESLVFAEFKKSEASFNLALSYWPPDSKDLATGIKTPPVLLTNDGALRYFFTHMKVTGSLNLFATFESLGYCTAAAPTWMSLKHRDAARSSARVVLKERLSTSPAWVRKPTSLTSMISSLLRRLRNSKSG
ncbi:unnamed protein product [Brassica rapa]|uniref:Uncharacterized protein n=1 Tax=Brassica campestris TaxID=3711 RepID=A0A8D9DI57_BRACM|nr:unnamed protein product [Brassica rapa]